MRLALAAPLLLLAACSDQNLFSSNVDAIAVTLGDFDEIAAPLDRAEATYEEYEGTISSMTWDDEREPEDIALKVESLFSSEDELRIYDLIMVASGTRGLGDRVYNGVDDDDALLKDTESLGLIEAWVDRGNTLFVTDWSYDLIEAIWPDAADFLNEDDEPDAAQRGALDHYISATVETDALVNALGSETINLDLNYGNWSIVDDVGADTTPLLYADVSYRDTEGGGDIPLTGVPMLFVHQPPGANGGRVIFASFHVGAQNPIVIDKLLEELLGEYNTQTTSEASLD